MSGSTHSVGGRIQTAHDGRGNILQVETEGDSKVFVVWGGDGNGFILSPPIDKELEGNWKETALGDHGSRWRSTHL